MKITKCQRHYGLEDHDGNTVLHNEYHAVFQISRELYGYRRGGHFGIIKTNGEIVVPPILVGYTEFEDFTTEYLLYLDDHEPLFDIEEPLTYKFDGKHYMREFNSEFIEDHYDMIELEEGQPYVLAKDYKGKNFLCDWSGNILSYGEYDEIRPINNHDLFLVIKHRYGNIWNFRTGEMMLERFIYYNNFKEDVYGKFFVEMDESNYLLNAEKYRLEYVANVMTPLVAFFN